MCFGVDSATMPDMESKARCQSCSMPLAEDLHGTEAGGQPSAEYCKYCYQNGAFTMPNLKLDEAVKAAVDYMHNTLNMGEEQAEVMANAVIPTLKRWRGGGK